jgi:cold shock CspA family protein
MPVGTIDRINPRGFGFIKPFDSGPDVMFHFAALIDMQLTESVGRQVRYTVIETAKGTGLQAWHVWPE